jgi:hypothetical protein
LTKERTPSDEPHEVVECWYCREEIRADARKCRYCGELVRAEKLDRALWTEWEYQYVYLDASEVGGHDQEGREWRRQDPDKLQQELTEWGQHCWELVAAVPVWRWCPVVDQSLETSYAYVYPTFVLGWYCIFRRPLRPHLQNLPRPDQTRSAGADAGEAK